MSIIDLTNYSKEVFGMANQLDNVSVSLQIALNKRMYELGKIPYDTYSRVNEILNYRLTYCNVDGIITCNEMKASWCYGFTCDAVKD